MFKSMMWKIREWVSQPSKKARIAELEKQVKELKSQSLWMVDEGFYSRMITNLLYGSHEKHDPITVKQVVKLIAKHLDVTPERTSSELVLITKRATQQCTVKPTERMKKK
jgi:hypothetical protein